MQNSTTTARSASPFPTSDSASEGTLRPVIGDANYGRSEHNRLLAERVGLRRLALHASSIELAREVHQSRIER